MHTDPPGRKTSTNCCCIGSGYSGIIFCKFKQRSGCRRNTRLQKALRNECGHKGRNIDRERKEQMNNESGNIRLHSGEERKTAFDAIGRRAHTCKIESVEDRADGGLKMDTSSNGYGSVQNAT